MELQPGPPFTGIVRMDYPAEYARNARTPDHNLIFRIWIVAWKEPEE